MKKKQLMIGIPTKDHPRYIQFQLAKMLDVARESSIDLHIYDSSEDDLTQNVVYKKIEQEYDNLFYHKYSADLRPEEKIKDILVGSGYEYVWLCGDGVILNLENMLTFISDQMEKGKDLMIFNPYGSRDGYIEYTDPIRLILEQWNAIALYGGTIYKGDFFTEQEWANLFPLYTANIQLAGIFDIYARKPVNAVSVDTWFCTNSVYKDASTWVENGNVFQVTVDHLPAAIRRLPSMYDPVKKQVEGIFAGGTDYFSVPGICFLRATGNITARKLFRYRKQLKELIDAEQIDFNYMLAWCATLVPKKAARKLANVFYS